MNDFYAFSALLQSYHGDSLNIHVLPVFHQCKARTLKCLAQGHFHENSVDPVTRETRSPTLYDRATQETIYEHVIDNRKWLQISFTWLLYKVDRSRDAESRSSRTARSQVKLLHEVNVIDAKNCIWICILCCRRRPL